MLYGRRYQDTCCVVGMEEGPKATLDIQRLWRGGRVAVITTLDNNFLHRKGSGSTRAIATQVG